MAPAPTPRSPSSGSRPPPERSPDRASCCSSTILRRSGWPRSSASSRAVPGVASTAPGGRAGDDALVTATIRANADEDAVAERAIDVFARSEGVTVGGGAVAGLQIGETVGADLGRAELIAFRLLLLLIAAVLPWPRRR